MSQDDSQINDMAPLSGCYGTHRLSLKHPMKLLHSLFKVFIRIQQFFIDKNSDSDIIGNKCNNYDKNTGFKWYNKELNELITIFLIRGVIQNVGLSWIVNNNKHLKFYIQYNWCKMVHGVIQTFYLD